MHGLVIQVMAGCLLLRSVEADDLDVPELRERRGDVGKAQTMQRGRAHRGDQQIRRVQQDVERGPTGRILQIEDGHLLAGGQLRIPSGCDRCQRIPCGRFDLGNARPQVAQARGGQGAREVGGEGDDIDAVEGACHSIPFEKCYTSV